MHTALAIDLGAGCGRVMRGTFAQQRLTIEEIHRFPNELRLSAGQRPLPASIGLDAWGVDFVLLDKLGDLLEEPVACRDSRTVGMMAQFFERIDRDAISQLTGMKFMPINTLYQLHALRKENPAILDRAATLLMIPDYLKYRLTGHRATEFTIATTSQMIHAWGAMFAVPSRVLSGSIDRSSMSCMP